MQPDLYADKTLVTVFAQIVFALFFIVLGIKNMMARKMVLARMREFGVPFAALSLAFGFVMQFTGATFVLLDIYTVLAVPMLIVFTVVATWIFHRFWLVPDGFRRDFDFNMIVYNVFVIAGLIMIM